MVSDKTQVRIDKELWELVKSRADLAGVSGAEMMRQLLDGGNSIGSLLADEIRKLQKFCQANEAEIVKYFETDDEDPYEWLTEFMGRILSSVEFIESEADQDDEY